MSVRITTTIIITKQLKLKRNDYRRDMPKRFTGTKAPENMPADTINNIFRNNGESHEFTNYLLLIRESVASYFIFGNR
ncbi:hypothetical protein Q764_08960 [Flavobacterium suncheonense GH29-5 = DSM 17707]|uniref:Uncharacterized protein n=1 Tax=Flavobacterium suncheonense GH29-5 = DSM 17707 TaxID=1121899 RepID=A0A0A2M972_9FLAO|nr:hypothetical protein Q764_08960 [Flavobacterium suncheonense GH29-5 = DSM 17707]